MNIKHQKAVADYARTRAVDKMLEQYSTQSVQVKQPKEFEMSKTFHGSKAVATDAKALEAAKQQGIRDQVAADGASGAQVMDKKFIAEAKAMDAACGSKTAIDMRWDARLKMNRPVVRYENGLPVFLS